MLRLAFIGTNEGNGHIFSWSAIINGKYDKEKMAECGYSLIPRYLGRQPKENLGIPGARVTHVWTEDRIFAARVAETTFIENVLDRPVDAIGKVDGVIVTTDIGSTHIELAEPFIRAGIPVFIDKPLCDSEDDLRRFVQFRKEGRKILSSSSMRYANEIESLNMCEIGEIRFVSTIMSKTWERYGVHAFEGLYMIAGPGVKSVLNIGDEHLNVAHINFFSGKKAVLQVVYNSGIFGRYDIFGDRKTVTIETIDFFSMFKKQLVAAVEYIKIGREPYPFEETVEIIKVIIAGIKSRNEKREIELSEIVID